jgi:XTP/dITP diphosphohydrolase
MRALLLPLGIEVLSLSQLDNAIEVAETGATFIENARLKAVQQATHLKTWVLAEDSGLSVPALDGRPGVYSARYSGPGATDESNNLLLLSELANIQVADRGAFYTCQLCLADPAGEIRFETTGECHGMIGTEPLGSSGFGYDPLFIIHEYHQTFAQLGPATKQAISHRARAMRKFLVGGVRAFHSPAGRGKDT